MARLVAEPFEMMNIWLENSVQLIDRIDEISAGASEHRPDDLPGNGRRRGRGRQRRPAEHAPPGTRPGTTHAARGHRSHDLGPDCSDLARLITLLWPEDERHLSIDQIAARLRSVGLANVQVRDLERRSKTWTCTASSRRKAANTN